MEELQDNKDNRLRGNSFVYDVLTKSEIIWLLNPNPCEQAATSSSPTNVRFQIRLKVQVTPLILEKIKLLPSTKDGCALLYCCFFHLSGNTRLMADRHALAEERMELPRNKGGTPSPEHDHCND
ncbi:uncharacterized protein LOC125537286 [Triticum urartu]|nr:uncharacterized protein LOC125537286 [Triticum urartu]